MSPSRATSTLYEELASRGYVVTSIEHAHHTLLTIFPDDGEQTKLGSSLADALNSLPANPALGVGDPAVRPTAPSSAHTRLVMQPCIRYHSW